MKIRTSFRAYKGYPARIMHWPERYGQSYTLWHHLNSGRTLANGDPEVCRRIVRGDELQARLSPAIERWLFGLMKECTFGRVNDDLLKKAYANLLADDRAYTDYSGWFYNQSVILDLNIGASPMRMGYAIPNGATVMVVGKEEMVAGKLCLPILALDVLDPQTLKATYKDDPYTIACATNCVTEPQPMGKVDPFPVLGELGYSTPVPILAQGQNYIWIESAWIKRLETTGRQYPYYETAYTTVRW
jgi:hypothetical protein